MHVFILAPFLLFVVETIPNKHLNVCNSALTVCYVLKICLCHLTVLGPGGVR